MYDVQFQVNPAGPMPPFAGAGDFVPILPAMPGVTGPMCIPAGLVARGPSGGVATTLMPGHPLSALRGVTTDGATSAAAGGTAHPVLNLSKLSAHVGVSEHGMITALFYASVLVVILYRCSCDTAANIQRLRLCHHAHTHRTRHHYSGSVYCIYCISCVDVHVGGALTACCTHMTVYWPFVWDYPGEPVPEK